MRDGFRRLRALLWVAVAVGTIASASPRLIIPAMPQASGSAARSTARAAGQDAAATARTYGQLLANIGKDLAGPSQPNAIAEAAAAEATAARKQPAQTGSSAGRPGGGFVPGVPGTGVSNIPVGTLARHPTAPEVQPLGRLRPADLLVVAPKSLPAGALTAILKLPGVTAADLVDAARIKVNGGYVATLGVDPWTFREFAAPPTARSSVLWQNVASGGVAVSYLMGKEEKLPLDGTVTVVGSTTEKLPVAGFGTVGISGVDAVVSDSVARSLGMPAGNAIVVSAPKARLSVLMRQLKLALPRYASVAPLVYQPAASGIPVTAGSAGAYGVTTAAGPGLSDSQIRAFLTASLSRVGLEYVWGGSGPQVFDCSGLVQWSLRQAGIIMPRVAVDQAQTGPRIPLADLQPGDLLFYHTDPTAPTYISHVAIYLGDGLMEQAPQPGMTVQVVPADFGAGFAGAVRIYPRVAAAVAASLAG